MSDVAKRLDGSRCQCAVFMKEKLSSVLCLIASTFVEIVRYHINTVHWLSLRLDEEQLPTFTQRPTPWQSWLAWNIWVTDSRILGPVWCIHSIVLRVKGGSAVTRWYFNVFRVVFGKKKHVAFKWKGAILGFLFPHVVQKHKLSEVKKINHIWIVHFLGNTCAKHYRNRTAYVEIIASQSWDAFETRCIVNHFVQKWLLICGQILYSIVFVFAVNATF